MRLLVTGGAGLIGRAAVAHLLESGHDVVSILRSPSQLSPENAPGLREVVGDAGDVELLETLMGGVDSVLHLAAVPHPGGRTARELLIANSLMTIAVLEAAGSAGVRSAVVASSISILGMAWSAELMSPLEVPITEEHSLRPTEGYSLSKETDEAIARMASRRWNMSIASLRFPFTQTMEIIEATKLAAETKPDQAAQSAKELWAYLDLRDAARACELALRAVNAAPVRGWTAMNIVAPDLLLDPPLSQLLGEWHPEFSNDVPVHQEREPYSTRRATEEIGFTARHFVHHPATAPDSSVGTTERDGSHG